jgi:hypothetical protein
VNQGAAESQIDDLLGVSGDRQEVEDISDEVIVRLIRTI